MTDLTDEALDKLVAQLTDIGKFAIGGGTASDAAAVITALRQREAEAVAGAIEAAAKVAHEATSGSCQKCGHPRDNHPYRHPFVGRTVGNVATAIRALHTDATRAALDKVRAEGMREAANICTAVIREYDVMKPDGKTYEPIKVQKAAKGLVSIARQDILAAADKLEGKP